MTALDVQNLHKRYGDHVAVEDVSFRVEEGEIFGIVGPNGAGKTTTVESIAGLRTPDSGRISVLGRDPLRDRAEVQEMLGVQLQQSSFPDEITVSEALELFAAFYREPADRHELIDLLGLGAKRDARYKTLSGGQKQRLSIAVALVGSPRIAILDELTTGLDPEARRETWSLIERVRDTGVTILLVTHFMDEAERLSDQIAVIAGGRVAAIDSPSGLIARASTAQQIRFRVREPLEREVLSELPGVRDVEITEGRWRVTGGSDLLGDVASALARRGVVAEELRVERATLDDAVVAFTGHAPEPSEARQQTAAEEEN